MKTKRFVLFLILVLSLSTNVYASEVPISTVVQTVNSTQQIVKIYTVSPETKPQELIEAPFTLDGYLYAYSDIAKEETWSRDTYLHRETVSVETRQNDLSAILKELDSTLTYEKNGYAGTLVLDHASLHTEAASYSRDNRTITVAKIIGPLDRNDMSYIPAITVQDGKTLSLVDVEWQVIGTDVVGETLIPSVYQAVATYSGQIPFSITTGYVTTAEYVGEVVREDVESVTYRITYLGKPVPAEEEHTFIQSAWITVQPYLPYILCGFALIVAIIFGLCLFHRKKEDMFQTEDIDDMENSELEAEK